MTDTIPRGNRKRKCEDDEGGGSASSPDRTGEFKDKNFQWLNAGKWYNTLMIAEGCKFLDKAVEEGILRKKHKMGYRIFARKETGGKDEKSLNQTVQRWVRDQFWKQKHDMLLRYWTDNNSKFQEARRMVLDLFLCGWLIIEHFSPEQNPYPDPGTYMEQQKIGSATFLEQCIPLIYRHYVAHLLSKANNMKHLAKQVIADNEEIGKYLAYDQDYITVGTINKIVDEFMETKWSMKKIFAQGLPMSPEIRDIFERVRAVSKDHHEQVWLKINKLLEGKGFGNSLKSGKFDKITNYEQLRLALYKEITQKNVMEDVSNDDWLHAWTTMTDIMNKTQLPTDDVHGMETQLVATNSGVVQKRAERSGGYCLVASPQGEEVDITKWMSDMRQVLLWSQSYGDALVLKNQQTHTPCKPNKANA